MPVSLQTPISSPCLSAALPHELCFSVGPDTKSAEVHIRAGGETIFTATLYACKQRIILFDCRSIIEGHFLERKKAHDICNILLIADDEQVETGRFFVIMSEFDAASASDFLNNNFLTTRRSFRICRHGVQSLSWFSLSPEPEFGSCRKVELASDTEFPQSSLIASSRTYETSTLHTETIKVDDLQITDAKLLAFTIERGARSITFYVTDEKPDLTFHFRNAFNCPEHVELYGVTTAKQEVSRSEAQCLNKSIFYDQTTLYSYEVETAAITPEDALWLQQFFCSRYTAVEVNGQYREILITSSEVEPTTDNSKLCRAKFTFKFADNARYLSPEQTRIFTEYYQSEFK